MKTKIILISLLFLTLVALALAHANVEVENLQNEVKGLKLVLNSCENDLEKSKQHFNNNQNYSEPPESE